MDHFIEAVKRNLVPDYIPYDQTDKYLLMKEAKGNDLHKQNKHVPNS
jgi:hypothetical protein